VQDNIFPTTLWSMLLPPGGEDASHRQNYLLNVRSFVSHWQPPPNAPLLKSKSFYKYTTNYEFQPNGVGFQSSIIIQIWVSFNRRKQ
jgi:hypothetical protein